MSSKRGRPTRYSSNLTKRLPLMFDSGESVAEVCRSLGVPRSTFYGWAERYPEFRAALDHGLDLSEAYWNRIGREAAVGDRKINPSCWIFTMKNRFGWRDNTRERDNAMEPEEYARRAHAALRAMEVLDHGGDPSTTH